jgi:hypothetical protein
VVAAEGEPLAGASIVVFDQTGNQLGTAQGDPLGRYALGLPPGEEYLVVAHAPGRDPVAAWVPAGATSTRYDAAVDGTVLTDR